MRIMYRNRHRYNQKAAYRQPLKCDEHHGRGPRSMAIIHRQHVGIPPTFARDDGLWHHGIPATGATGQLLLCGKLDIYGASMKQQHGLGAVAALRTQAGDFGSCL